MTTQDVIPVSPDKGSESMVNKQCQKRHIQDEKSALCFHFEVTPPYRHGVQTWCVLSKVDPIHTKLSKFCKFVDSSPLMIQLKPLLTNCESTLLLIPSCLWGFFFQSNIFYVRHLALGHKRTLSETKLY